MSAAALNPWIAAAKLSPVLSIKPVQKAIDDPNVFVFGELLALPSVQAMSGVNDEGLRTYALLQLFAFGTYADYKTDRVKYPELSPARLNKLKMLSLVTLCASVKAIRYADIASALDLGSVEAVEELITECIDAGLITGRMNQRDAELHCSSTIGRDVSPARLDEMLAQLIEWQASTQSVVSAVKSQQEAVASTKAAEKKEQEDLATAVAVVRLTSDEYKSKEGEGRRGEDGHTPGDPIDEAYKRSGRPGGKRRMIHPGSRA